MNKEHTVFDTLRKIQEGIDTYKRTNKKVSKKRHLKEAYSNDVFHQMERNVIRSYCYKIIRDDGRAEQFIKAFGPFVTALCGEDKMKSLARTVDFERYIENLSEDEYNKVVAKNEELFGKYDNLNFYQESSFDDVTKMVNGTLHRGEYTYVYDDLMGDCAFKAGKSSKSNLEGMAMKICNMCIEGLETNETSDAYVHNSIYTLIYIAIFSK